MRREADVALDAREAERVWGRMQRWALDRFGDELGAALKEHMGARGVGTDERPALDEDLSLALCWLLIDREVEAGGTPARLYVELSELSAGERQIAARIAASGLGLHRVREAQPGAWIELENLLDRRIVRVASPNVSREAVRWHVLLCRVMQGGPTASLWGAAGFHEPAEEPELLDELRRIAIAHGLGAGTAGLEAALRVGAGELLCFVPPSRRAERVPYTLEGDAVAVVEASWKLRDPDAAFDALCAARELALDGETEDGKGVTFSWLTSRRELLARRPPLPVGAIYVESGPVAMSPDGELEADDLTSLGTFTVRGGRLEFFGLLRGAARVGDGAHRAPAGALGRSAAQQCALAGHGHRRDRDGRHARARGVTRSVAGTTGRPAGGRRAHAEAGVQALDRRSQRAPVRAQPARCRRSPRAARGARAPAAQPRAPRRAGAGRRPPRA
jgi:hypothetical protein